MENRMRNTFVLLAVVALAHSGRADEQISVPVTAPQAAPSTPVSDIAHDHHPESASPTTKDVHVNLVSPALNATNNGSTPPIQIEVFYEALCKDSVDFVQNQLSPVYNKLNKFINVSFIPFGQGNITKLDDTHYNLTCSRPSECPADQVHACGIDHIKDQDKLLKFVNCSLVEGFKNKTVPIEECGTNSNLDKSIIESIKLCTTNGSSYPLLERYSKLSHENHVKFVPRIVINGNYSEATQQLSLTNLMQAVCKLIPTSDSPAECKHAGSGSSTVVVGILPLLISVYYFIRMF